MCKLSNHTVKNIAISEGKFVGPSYDVPGGFDGSDGCCWPEFCC